MSGMATSGMRRLAVGTLGEQDQWVKIEPTADALHAPERQIPLVPLDGAHVGPVDAQDVRECLLAQSSCLPVGPQIAPHSPPMLAHLAGRVWLPQRCVPAGSPMRMVRQRRIELG